MAPGDRLRFLDDACAGDGDTRREVESLLASFDDDESFMEHPAVGEVVEVAGEVRHRPAVSGSRARRDFLRSIRGVSALC